MRIIVELKLNGPYELSEDEIADDLLAGEDQIGWEYDYTIKSIKVGDSEIWEAD